MEILASWDDGSIADLKMAELMSKYDVPTIFYWPSMLEKAKNRSTTSSWLTEENCKEIASRFEIGSHSMSHQPMNRMTIPQLAVEITDSRKYWQDVTGQEINSFAYPKNSINNMAKALIKGAGYKSARTSITGWLKSGDDPFAIQCTVQIGIDRIEYSDKCWEYFADEMLEKANDESVFYIFGNSWDVETHNDWDALESLIKKIKS